jgi:hypothetical protein
MRSQQVLHPMRWAAATGFGGAVST